MLSSSGFVVRDARTVRDALLHREGSINSMFVKFTYRPFDDRWLFWTDEPGLLGRPVPGYMPNVFDGNLWLSSAQHLRKDSTEPQAYYTRHISSLHLIERGAAMFPTWLRGDVLGVQRDEHQRIPNLSHTAKTYVDRIGADVEEMFHHVLAVLHDPAYREANAGALRMDWPRIPIPGWHDGGSDEDAAELLDSAARGREIAALLDSDVPVMGVTAGPLRSELAW